MCHQNYCFFKGFADKSSTSVGSKSESSNRRIVSTQCFSMVNLLASALSVFESRTQSSDCEKRGVNLRRDGWTAAVRKVLTGGSMRRFQERILRSCRTGMSSSTSDIWLLGVCYRVLPDDSEDSATDNGLVAFERDFSSRILMTYRKGFYDTMFSFFPFGPYIAYF